MKGKATALDLVITGVSTVSLVCFLLLFYLFPDGMFVPGWSRWVAALLAGSIALDTLVPHGSFDPFDWGLPGYLVGLALAGSMVYAQVHHYRRVSGPVERQQTKWFVFGMTLAIMGFVNLGWPTLVFPALAQPGAAGLLYDLVSVTILLLAFLLVPLAIGMAVLRYRLWDIDVIINRTLVYGALTASTVGFYMLIAGGLGAMLQVRGNVLLSLLAAGSVAVVFAPLRDRLQRGANRLMYGERDDPYSALARLGRRLEDALEPQTILSVIAETVAHALKLPYVAVELKQGDQYALAASFGQPAGLPLLLPLIYRAEPVGRLVLCPRSPDESWGPADRRLLADLTRQAGIAVHAVRLTADLQRSRERLVTAREEERRRLRRDLHDGLGPALSSVLLKLGAARRLLPPNCPADHLIVDVREIVRATVADVRQLVYDLRPPALDQLGLVLAIRDYADQCSSQSEDGLRVTVTAPEPLQPLPNIASRRMALTNVVRHARADLAALAIHQGIPLFTRLAGHDTGLPVRDLAERPAPLVGDADRMRALLGKIAAVHDETQCPHPPACRPPAADGAPGCGRRLRRPC